MTEPLDAESLRQLALASALSNGILERLQYELERQKLSPAVAAMVLTVCLGRLAGRHAFRSVSMEACWQACFSEDKKPLFELGFTSEREHES